MTKTYSYEDALSASIKYFNGNELAAKVFLDKYALRDNEQNLLEKTPEDMHRRIAKEFARIEKKKFKKPLTEDEIFDYLDQFKKIIPQGSPMYGIGNKYQITSLSNCYVIEPPLDSYSSILKTDEELAQISKRRGGNGTDMENLRPAGTVTHNAAKTSTGSIPFCIRYSNTIREVGQCIAAGEKVLTENGLKNIEDIKKGVDSVWTRKGFIPVLDVKENGIKKTYKTTTVAGYSIKSTENHVFVDENNNEKQLKDFEIGERIVLIPGTFTNKEYVKLKKCNYEKSQYNNSNRLNESVVLPDTLDEDLAYLLGFAYGDGYVEYKNGEPVSLGFSFSIEECEVINKVCEIAKNSFNYELNQKKINGNWCVFRLNSKLLLNHLKNNNLLKGLANNLGFPESIYRSPSSVQGAFVSGLFDADGCAMRSKKVYKLGIVDLSFINHIQQVLFANGIASKVHSFERQENWNDIHVLCVVGKVAQERFKKFAAYSEKVKNSDWELKRDCWLTPYDSSALFVSHNRFDYIPTGEQKLSANAYSQLNEELELDKLTLIDEISLIEECGFKETYDLVLPEENLFYCQGFYVHNSGRRGALMLTQSIHHPESVIPWDESVDGPPKEVKVANKDLGSFTTNTKYYNPDKIDFCTMKYDPTKVTGANISLRLTDEFLNAVEKNEKYEQRWPVNNKTNPVISKHVDANAVWDKIVTSSHRCAEPGVLFWDNIIKESIPDCYSKFGFESRTTNPCGEIILCANDSCRLLLLNLFGFVVNPFKKDAYFDFKSFYESVMVAQRLMDDLVDLEEECINRIIDKVNSDPEPEYIKSRELSLWKNILKMCVTGRRTGTGITALGDTLAALNIGYGTTEGIQMAEKIYRTLKFGAYSSSVEMAKEIGHFPVWDHELEKNNPYLNRIKNETVDLGDLVISGEDLWKRMKKYGRRNIALLTTAPAGTVSILTKLVNHYGSSSGIEPQYEAFYIRKKKGNPGDKNFRTDSVDASGDHWMHFTINCPALMDWMEITGEKEYKKSPWFKNCAVDLDWNVRVRLQAAAQKHVDHSISSTINLPNNVSVEKVKEIYTTAWKSGCKGVTVYRDGCRTGVLVKNVKKNFIPKTDAPPRPDSLPCDVHHVKVKGEEYFVLVGLYGDDPYEVFAGKNGVIGKHVTSGIIEKKGKGRYDANFADGTNFSSVADYISDDEEAQTRLVSTALRHGADIAFIVHQLEKVKGKNMYAFSRALARALKKYIKDGVAVKDACENCGGKLVRENGCVICKDCGASKCN